MLKLFSYECRRVLGGKAFLGLAAVTLWYARQTLHGEVIWGVANTAPFSPWSFGYYLAALLPLLCAAGLLLMARFYTKPARQTLALVRAAPLPPWKYALVRCGAVALGLGALSLCVAGMGVLFLRKLFGAVPMDGFVPVAAFTLLPLPVLALGLGAATGRSAAGERWGAAPLYGLAGLLFLLPALPGAWEPTGLAFFQNYPAVLGVLDPPLQIPLSLWLGRAAMLLAGMGMLGIGAARRGRNKKKESRAF